MLLTLTDEPQPHVAQPVTRELVRRRTKGAAELGGKNTSIILIPTAKAGAGNWR